MPSVAFKTAKQTNAKHSGECVQLVEAESADATKSPAELRSATDEPLRIEWAIDLSSGTKRLSKGGVGVVVLDLALSHSHCVGTFDRLCWAVRHVPVLVLSDAGGEETAREVAQRGARDYVIKNQGDGYRLTGRCAP